MYVDELVYFPDLDLPEDGPHASIDSVGPKSLAASFQTGSPTGPASSTPEVTGPQPSRSHRVVPLGHQSDPADVPLEERECRVLT